MGKKRRETAGRRRGPKCPYCGSRNTAEIVHGLPAGDEEMMKKVQDGEVHLGGCLMMTVKVNGEKVFANTSRYCNDCEREFGAPPLLIAYDKLTAEYYPDIVETLIFEIPDMTIELNRDDEGSVPGEWEGIVEKLYWDMFLHEWDREQSGTEGQDESDRWKLTVKMTGGREAVYSGSRAGTPYWSELENIFMCTLTIR